MPSFSPRSKRELERPTGFILQQIEFRRFDPRTSFGKLRGRSNRIIFLTIFNQVFPPAPDPLRFVNHSKQKQDGISPKVSGTLHVAKSLKTPPPHLYPQIPSNPWRKGPQTNPRCWAIIPIIPLTHSSLLCIFLSSQSEVLSNNLTWTSIRALCSPIFGSIRPGARPTHGATINIYRRNKNYLRRMNHET